MCNRLRTRWFAAIALVYLYAYVSFAGNHSSHLSSLGIGAWWLLVASAGLWATRPSWRIMPIGDQWLYALIASPAVSLLIILVFIEPSSETITLWQHKFSITSAFAWTALSLATAVVEEVIFRGYLFEWLSRRLSNWLAIMCGTALFGAAHFSESMVGPICGGFVCCVLRSRWSTLLPVMGFHFVWNLFVGAADFAIATALTETQDIARATLQTEGAIFPLAGILFCVMCLTISITKRPVHRTEKPIAKFAFNSKSEE